MQLGDDDERRVEDRRGTGGGRRPGLKLGMGGLAVVGLLSVVFKQNFFALLDGGASNAPSGAPLADDPGRRAREEPLKKTAVRSFNDAQRELGRLLPGRYREATLVLFWDEVHSGCGGASAASGPFYCPADEKVYLDLGFFDELSRRFGAPGDFAQGYVVAHEMGHHLQRVLRVGAGAGGKQASVRTELQADCLAGVWGATAARRKLLDPGDLEEGLRAAAAIGDDRLQKMAGRSVSPESFTHGSSAERVRAFKSGFEAGDLAACDVR